MNLSRFVIFGISHKEFSMPELEEFLRKNPKKIIEKLYMEKKIKGFVNLSTCLRVEFYFELDESFSFNELKKYFPVDKNPVLKQGEEALRYLFEVSCGFYSIIKGEDQILAQIKTAYSIALENEHSSKLLNRIFNKAIELGKKFRTKSLISHNSLSLEAISLRFIKNELKDLENKNILVLGVGELAKSLLKLLKKENLKNIYITNRTFHKVLPLKEIYNANVINFREKYDYISECDIVVSATSAPHFILTYEKLKDLLDPNKKYTFLDLAMPRDIDPNVKSLENVALYNLDDVWKKYNLNIRNRDKLIKSFSYLIDEQEEKLLKSLSYYERNENTYEKRDNNWNKGELFSSGSNKLYQDSPGK